MDEVLKYIKELEAGSFAAWSEEAKNGYLTACGSIKAKILNQMGKPCDHENNICVLCVLD